MSEFFKSAMGYFNSTPPNSSTSSSYGGGGINTQDNYVENEFCGQIVEIKINNEVKQLKIKRVISEGGFAFVYVAQDLQNGKEYALKRLFGADKQACNAIINEINIHKQISGHPNIVDFVAATFVNKMSGPQQRAEYLLLSELCKGGSLIDCLSNFSTLDPPLVLRIFYQAAKAVAHMHSQMPPIIHRDIKIENFLIGSEKQLKLCDFGSATSETFSPTLDWNAQQRNMLEDQLNSVTTPMYRAPEMLDTWSNYEIGPKIDIWALGCILYVLCFQKHPYEDSAKLRIINGNYILPTDTRFNCFHEIIKGCFVVNPAQRFNISMILERLAALAETNNWSLKGPIDLHGRPIVDSSPIDGIAKNLNTNMNHCDNNSQSSRANQQSASNTTFYTDTPSVPPRQRPSPPQQQHQAHPHAQQQQQQQQHQSTSAQSSSSSGNSSLFSSLRGGAGNFLKNLKDTSSKVMQTMQQTIGRNDLDISYITSRVLVMPCPSEGLESAYKTNNIEDVRLSIESRFPPQKVSVYNFGNRSCPRLSPPVRTVEVGAIYACPQSRAPNLQGMFSVAEDMYGFLKADPKSIVIIQTADSGGCSAATMVCALLMYSDLILEPEDAVQVFAIKRHPINLRPSEFRYLYYFGDIIRPTPLLPHFKTFNLVSLSCQPVPKMTRARDGCRIYVEVYCNDNLLLTTIQDYEKMRLYLAGPGKITLPIDLSVCGDLTVVLYHARNALKGMVRPQGLKICQFQIHTGFIPEQETLITFGAQDLDDLPDDEQVSHDFVVSLSLSVTEQECLPTRNPPWIPQKPKRNPSHLFSSQLEYEEMVDNFVTKPISNKQIEPDTNESSEFEMNVKKEKPIRPPSPLILPDVTETTHECIQSIPEQEPTPPIDLLNLNQPPPQQCRQDDLQGTGTAIPTSDASFDLLGAFGDDDSSGIGSAAIPDILVDNSQPNSSAGLDDIFGSIGGTESSLDFGAFVATTPMNTKETASNSFGSHTRPLESNSSSTFNVGPISRETSPQQPLDPFADIANLASGLNINFNPNTLGSKSAGTTPIGGSSPYTTQFASPTHNIGMRGPTPQPTTTSTTTQQSQAQNSSPNHTKSPTGNLSGNIPGNQFTTNASVPNVNRHQQQQQQQQQQQSSSNSHTNQSSRPDYSRTHFEAPKATQSNSQPKNADIFADILGQQGYKFGSKGNQGPRSINEMRKEDLIKDMDPDKVRIMEWTDGKKNNIRALLCSMHTVLWDNAKWHKCEMSTLITPVDVKKAYRRACLAVHPDKHNGTENEEIAKLVFMELNNAWTDFENDTTQQNMFNS